MKTIIFKKLLTISIILIFSWGCEDNLNLSPLDAPSNVTFFTNEDELILALNGAYRQTLFTRLGSEPSFAKFDLVTDLGFDRSHGGVKALALGSHDPSNNVVSSFWIHFYRSISRVNNLLDNMHKAEEVVSTEILERIEAEARFLRAFSYFHLTELYGDVPLLTEVPNPDDAHVARTPKEDVVKQIILDLDFAAQKLPVKWSSEDEGRVTRGAALTLKSKVALFNEQFNIAAETAQEVMNLGVYSLYDDYESLTLYKGIRNPEVVFDIPYKIGVYVHGFARYRGTQIKPSWSQSVPSQFLVDSYECIDGLPIDESPLYDYTKPFENRDPRLGMTVIIPQSIWGDLVIETHPDSTETWAVNEAGEHLSRIDNRDVTSAYSTFTGHLWRKYCDFLDFDANVDQSTIHFILLRYAEVLLIYAEARIENGNIDQSVLDAMNIVRARAYGVNVEDTSEYPAITTTNQADLRKIIRRERKVEFAGEGYRLFDIRRWRIAEHVGDGMFYGRPDGSYTILSKAPDINEYGHPHYGVDSDLYWHVEPRVFNPNKDYLWPIPQPEMDVNKAMTQNPGYGD